MTSCTKCSSPLPQASRSGPGRVCPVCESWECTRCGTMSLARDRVCAFCKAPPSPAAPSAASPLVQTHPSPQQGAERACPRCTLLNPVTAAVCAACEGPLAPQPSAGIPPPLPPQPQRPPPPPQQQPAATMWYPAQVPPARPPQQQPAATDLYPAQMQPSSPPARPPPPALPPPPPWSVPAPSSPAGSSALASFGKRQSSTAFFEEFSHEIEEARAVCRAARSFFVDFLNPAEASLYEWGSINPGGVLRPGRCSQDNGVIVIGGGADAGLQQFLGKLFGGASSGGGRGGQPQWRVLPPHGISADDIMQGELGDCWLLSAVSVLAQSRPELLERLFLVKEVNPEGVFAVKLWIDGEWKPFLIDGNFPVVYRSYLKFARCRGNEALWVSLLEKAYAKAYGGYRNIESGVCEDAFYTVTGMPCETLQLAEAERTARTETNEGVRRDATDPRTEVFVKMVSYCSGSCVIAASCGGDAQTSRNANARRLDSNHAYSVLAVEVCPVTKQRLVQLRNPWGRTAYAGVAPPQRPSSSPMLGGGHNGIFWMPYDEFYECFQSVTICITRPFRSALVARNIRCAESTGFLADDPESGVSVFRLPRSSTVHALVIQPDIRAQLHQHHGATRGGAAPAYVDMMLVLLRFIPGRGVDVVEMSPSFNKRVVRLEHMLDPGVYAIVPMSFQQGTYPRAAALTVNIASESDEVVGLPYDGVQFPSFNINEVLGRYLLGHPKATGHALGSLTCYDVVLGTSHWYVAVNNSRSDNVVFELDPSRSLNMYFARNAMAGGAVRTTVAPGMGEISTVGVVRPHDGSYSMGCSMQFRSQNIPRGLRGVLPRPATDSMLFAPFALR